MEEQDLDLQLSKQLVEPQGGTITVKSKIDEGSTFSFILPFQKTNAEVESERVIKELDIKVKNIKVLVVEDIRTQSVTDENTSG